MNKTYYIGSYRDDALNGPNRGWIVGKFLAEEPRKNDEVEIKYWEFNRGDDTDHPLKTSSIIECTLLLKGSLRGTIDNQDITMVGGDYVVIQPHTPNNLLVEVLEDCAGITIKAPSDPTAKQVL